MSRSMYAVITVVVLAGLGVGVLIGVLVGGDSTADAAGTLPESVDAPDTTQSTSATGVASEPSSSDAPECRFDGGEPFVGGPSVQLTDLGESNGALVRGAIYPHPDYEGNPWTQWGQGVVLPDGRFISAIGDHIGPDGNSFVYEYDPATGELSMLADILSYVDHVPGTWGYGKIHSQMTLGTCGEVYFSTYWGTYRGIEFEGNYRGDLLFRLDPRAGSLERLTVPVDLHGQASLAGAPGHGLVYGEAVDPLLKEQDIDEGPFFAYDVYEGETVFVGPDTPHVGFRAMIVDADERAYYSVGGRELAVYDPDSGELTTHPATMPGDWLRAATYPADDGSVYAVTRDPDEFFVLRPDGEIEPLGDAGGYVASVALSPDGENVYFMPGAHGNSWEEGAPLMSLDTATGEQTVVAELNDLVEETLGYTVGGTYNVAVSPEGDVVYVGVNASALGDDSGFGEVAMLVVELP